MKLKYILVQILFLKWYIIQIVWQPYITNVVGFTYLCKQCISSLKTKCTTPTNDEVYSIQLYSVKILPGENTST